MIRRTDCLTGIKAPPAPVAVLAGAMPLLVLEIEKLLRRWHGDLDSIQFS